jgi:hypothetical protein
MRSLIRRKRERKGEVGTNLAIRITFQTGLEQRGEFIDVADEELEDGLTEGVFGREHSVIGMGENSWLEDDRQICNRRCR